MAFACNAVLLVFVGGSRFPGSFLLPCSRPMLISSSVMAMVRDEANWLFFWAAYVVVVLCLCHIFISIHIEESGANGMTKQLGGFSSIAAVGLLCLLDILISSCCNWG